MVEDETALRSIARRVLTRRGYRVLDAASGPEALRLVREHADPIDLVLTDMVMPGMSGRALTDQLPLIGCEAPVLYMSGYTDDEILRRGLLDPETGFLQKPFSPNALAQAVRDALGQVQAVARA